MNAPAIDQRLLPRYQAGSLSAENPTDRLWFAQVREDPTLEVEAFGPLQGKHIAVVSSGGCTALTLMSHGASVQAFDLNVLQNHLLELKYICLATLPHQKALQFLGAVPAARSLRLALWPELRQRLSPACRTYWESQKTSISSGVLGAGVTERFLRKFMCVIRYLVQSPRNIARLQQLSSVEEQARFYQRDWNRARWRWLFGLCLNRLVFSKTYNEQFFQYVENSGFAEHFLAVFERTICTLPIRENYFLHYMLTNQYDPEALPEYLRREHRALYTGAPGRLEIHDASCQEFLQRCPPHSLDGLALSNLCEWLDESEIRDLFRLVLKAIKPGGVLVFRNFLGFTAIPESLKKSIVLRESYNQKLIARDRSLMQARIAVCDIRGGGNTS